MDLTEYILSFKNSLTEQGDLSHKDRFQIYQYLEEKFNNRQVINTIAIQCGLIDINKWVVSLQKISPTAQTCYDFLINENELFNEDKLNFWLNQISQDIDNYMFSDEVDFRKVALLSALKSALEVKIYGFDYSILLQSELDLDPEDWETAYFASISFAGYAIWESENNSINNALREQFWYQYLDKIVEIINPID